MKKLMTAMLLATVWTMMVVVGGVSSAEAAQQADVTPLSVKLVNGLSAAEQAAVIARNGGIEKKSIPALRLHVVAAPNQSLPLILQDYQNDPQVESVEVIKSRKAEGLSNDQHIGVQWALPKIDWELVYGKITPRYTAKIALLDTGIDAAHPDLKANVIAGTSMFDGSRGLTDLSGHGTQMAGIVAAVTNNRTGVAGVAFKGVKLMPVTVLGADNLGQDSDIIAGVVWAADNNADVILMGFSNPDYSQHLQDAIDYAWSKGAVLIAAVGNDGAVTPTFPAGDRGVIGVAATGQNDQHSSFSNIGQEVFLAAPGENIYSTDLKNTYDYFTGTSPSAAIVAGVAAFMKAVDNKLTNGMIVGRLMRSGNAVGTANEPDYLKKFGNGRINMAKALADKGIDEVQPVGAGGIAPDGTVIGPYRAAVATLFSRVTNGNWTQNQTWSTSACGGVQGQATAPPAAGDVVTICSGNNITVDSTVTLILSLTVASGGTLTQSSRLSVSAMTINGTVNSSNNLTITTLTINSGGTGNMNGLLIVSGATNVTGIINFASTSVGSRAMTFTGPVTLNSGAVWTEPASGFGANNTYSFANNFINNATTFNAFGTGVHTFSGTDMTISGATVTAIPSVTITGTTANSGTLTVSKTLAGAGTLTNNATGVLNIGAATVTPTLNATASGNTVNYNGGAQTVKATPYSNLIFSGTGVKSITLANGSTLASDNLTISNTVAKASISGTGLVVDSFTRGTSGSASGASIWGGTGSNATYVDTSYFDINAGNLTVTQDKRAASTINTPPTASAIIYGQTLAASTLSAGVGTPSGGTFTWTNPATAPAIGTSSPSVTYTPANNAAGLGSYTATSGSASLTVNQAATTTTVTTGGLGAATVVGESYVVSYTVAVTAPGAGTPTGNVTVSDGSATCIAMASAGTCNLTSVSPGAPKTITASYAGDTNFSSSNDATGKNHTVNKAATTTTVNTGSLGTATVVGESYAVSFTVAVTAPGAGTPTGNVTVSDGSATCIAMASAGTCNLTSVSPGAPKTITASYAGDSNFNSNVDATGKSHTVTKAATTTTVNTGSLGTATVIGESYAVSFTVAATAPGAGTPTGNVTVSDGSASCIAVASVGTCSLTTTTSGVKTITATYAGDSNFDVSSDLVGKSHMVNKITPVITWSNPASITYGTALSATQLNASSSVPAGVFVYNPPLGTILTAGNGKNLSVTFMPTDTVNYANANKTVTINVTGAASYTITSQSGLNGSVTPLGITSVNSGDSSPVYSIAAASGYKIMDIQLDGKSVGAISSHQFNNVTANHKISATFIPSSKITYPITTSVTGAGGTLSHTGTINVLQGSYVNITFYADAGYYVSNTSFDTNTNVICTNDALGYLKSCRISNVTAPHSLDVTFSLIP